MERKLSSDSECNDKCYQEFKPFAHWGTRIVSNREKRRWKIWKK